MGNKIANNYSAKVGREVNAENWYKKLGYGTKIDGGLNTGDYGVVGLYKDVQVTSAQILALNATPVTLLAAPGANKFIAVTSMMLFLDYNSAAYGGIAAGEDWTIRYTDASGATLATIETTGLLDATSDQIRLVLPTTAAAFTPVANSPIVLHQSTGEITTGDSPVYFRMFYDILQATLSV